MLLVQLFPSVPDFFGNHVEFYVAVVESRLHRQLWHFNLLAFLAFLSIALATGGFRSHLRLLVLTASFISGRLYRDGLVRTVCKACPGNFFAVLVGIASIVFLGRFVEIEDGVANNLRIRSACKIVLFFSMDVFRCARRVTAILIFDWNSSAAFIFRFYRISA